MEKKQWIGFLLILLIFSTIFIKTILLRIDHKEAIGIVLSVNKTGSSVETYRNVARYKYKVDGKTYYKREGGAPSEIRRGIKLKIIYFPLLPSICSTTFKEIIINDSTTFLEDD